MSRVQYFCTQRKEVYMTEDEIRARNEIVLAARNAGEEALREKLSKMKWVRQSQRPSLKSRSTKDWEKEYGLMKVYVDRDVARRMKQYASALGISRVGRMLEIMFESYQSAQAEFHLMTYMLAAIRIYNEEKKNGEAKS